MNAELEAVAVSGTTELRPSTPTTMLSELRALAEHSPTRARAETWSYLRELGSRDDREALSQLFGAGAEPRDLDGKLDGQIVGKLFGIPEAKLANQLMRIDPTWRGKSFDLAAGTGLNRLSPLAMVAMPVVTFGYLGLRMVGGEAEGFGFDHSVQQGLIEPRVTVRALDYGVPRYRNPGVRTFPIRKTRDEIVELTPGVYLGRALLRTDAGEIRLIAYFALRHPVGSPL
ncbi:hypothetical protein [Nocardia neocaledoniensis]|uniref:hypothetical protein n=1 Tax=Nocardia neocaledoniensis TaxID=236511 RepID=UPI002455ABA8|nr:hypothetical protein [Nocardia neocaledoniensis]